MHASTWHHRTLERLSEFGTSREKIDGVEVVEYKVWIVDYLRQPGQIAVEDETERWEVDVDLYEDDWAWGHGQDLHLGCPAPYSSRWRPTRSMTRSFVPCTAARARHGPQEPDCGSGAPRGCWDGPSPLM